MTLQATTAGGSLAQASIRVTNTDQRAGADVPQMYIEDPASTGEPPRQLKGFSRVSLSPGQSATVHLPLNARALSWSLSWWNPSAHAWTVSRGCYTVAIGPNERDIAAQQTLARQRRPLPGGRRRQSRSAPARAQPRTRAAARRAGWPAHSLGRRGWA
jgi:beta-glucosidase